MVAALSVAIATTFKARDVLHSLVIVKKKKIVTTANVLTVNEEDIPQTFFSYPFTKDDYFVNE